MKQVPLTPNLRTAGDDAIRELLCASIDHGGQFAEAVWFVLAEDLLIAPMDPTQETWNAAMFRLTDRPGLRARFRMGAIDDDRGRSLAVLHWGAGDAWTASTRPADGGPWEVTRGRGYDDLRPGLLRWVDAGSRGVERLEDLTAHTRLRPPIRRDEFLLPFEPVRNAARLAEQLGAFFDELIARQGLAMRIVVLVSGRRCVVYELDLDVQIPLDDFVRTVAGRETCQSIGLLSPERSTGPRGEGVHEARLLVESAGRRAERRARMLADEQGRVRPVASVMELGKVRGGWIGVPPAIAVELTALGDTPGHD
jgi:hypothetical protein